ncbi:amidohydrolase family protein [Pedobacter zeae]|uniref:Imidazolonepropionase-like amidohydrolase n=1 Tax=Pedobacter zeae TaxID=1737356 RepID=A0A7W6KED9_9SPHI|nr:amidohydrolase family protein [Pedobacter zeae]MBB4109175.1 imidazolonepropionase-like amidohydrolase [Pedobacter zeae]GGH10743.1 periplasmic amidohydrolase [Pedobacter zeae]
MKKILLAIGLVISTTFLFAQQTTFPVNGSFDTRPGMFAFTNATIVVNANQTLNNATLLIKGQTIQAVGAGLAVPKGYVVIDLKGKFIYPSLVDAFTSYGLSETPAAQRGFGGQRQSIFVSTKKGAYGWNEAIRPETYVKNIFSTDSKKADELRKVGFGSVNVINRDGIARGVSAAVTLNEGADNSVILKDQSAANYSFNKGTSSNDYPTSLMGSIALLRQTYYDAQWYAKQKEEYNISLDEFGKQQDIPQIFEVDGWQNVLRADKIGKEFGKKYIIKSTGDEYQRINEVKATGASLIIPLTFPKAYDVEDPAEARNVSLSQMKGWELAPTNPAALEKAGIKFALTAFGLENSRDFWANIRTAIENGLSEKQALQSVTEIPASLLGISDKVGSLEKGKVANFLISSDNLFKNGNIIFENWVQGKRFVVNKMDVSDIRGTYNLTVDGVGALTLKITGTGGGSTAAIERVGADSVKTTANFTRNGDWISINFNLKKNPKGDIRLSGYLTSANPVTIKGESALADATTGKFTATYKEPAKETPKKDEPKATLALGQVIYPFSAFGSTEPPKQETVLIKNGTVWTNEKDGILQNADVLLENGKIKAVGKNLSASGAKVIDATGKHVTAGIIDEHSHIAGSGGINEGAQSVSAEVRVADIINSEDVNIYRQLAGGVTTSHILHGSANPIGGQSQLIKLRWGKSPEELKFAGADGFIKFALGENVKQSNFGTGARFPVTRMGVEQTFVDEFTRAKEYAKALSVKGNSVRRDLELDAIVEILNNKRFITCHSYVQSEINMLIHVADSLGFKINTFTHILEGYKVADKMKAHSIAGSTFSDWWAYKNEVAEAIPYNGKIMHNVGITTAFNSDDAEMARHLNQEAGKSVLYGNVPEEDALKFVTLNPARMLHIDDKVGSLKAGKDADVVIWTANPLSIYAKAEKTFVDGIAYWDIDKDAQMIKAQQVEKARLIQKMLESKSKGGRMQRPMGDTPRLYNCETLENYSAELTGKEHAY